MYLDVGRDGSSLQNPGKYKKQNKPVYYSTHATKQCTKV
jgi:hypothetical protein